MAGFWGTILRYTIERDGKIAFVRGGHIYVIGTDGSGLENLTNSAQFESEPAWSADGAKIAFRCNNICVMNADGSAWTDLQTAGSGPSWSPDGSRIAFSGNDDIFVMKADGSSVTNLTNSSRFEFAPAWSPDGSKIAFTRSDTSGGNTGIYVMNADGSGQTVVFDSLGSENGPEWSPDGKRIAFWQATQLAIINADGSGELAAGPTLGPNLFPISFAWSPGQTRFVIAALGPFSQTGGIYIVNADDTAGITKVRLTDEPGDYYPRWQPHQLLVTRIYLPLATKMLTSGW